MAEVVVPILYGAPWCAYCISLKSKLDKMSIKYDYRDVDNKEIEKEMLEKTNGNYLVPTVDVAGTIMQNPSIGAIRTELGV